MGDVINLSSYRKAKAKAEKERLAAENRVRHGRTRADTKITKAEQDRQAADLDGKRMPLAVEAEGQRAPHAVEMGESRMPHAAPVGEKRLPEEG